MKDLRLGDLCRDIPDARVPAPAAALRVGRVRDDSRRVQPGDVFVAVPGTDTDGAAHVADAVARGAVAVIAQTDALARHVAVPVVQVPDVRTALAELAAASFGRPAQRLTLVGITGTLGKTSVLAMLHAVLDEAGIEAASIGSLGIRYRGAEGGTPNTTPGVVVLQEALAGMADAGVRVAAMEVTSHALLQQRVAGLRFDLGIFTNLTMLEHLEYHDSFADYAAAKLRFLDQLAPAAPLVYAAGDRAVSQAARRHPGPRISCGGGGSLVTVRRDTLTLEGTRVSLRVRRPLPRVDGGGVEPLLLRLELRTLGRPNTMNAALAAAAALSLGAHPDAVQAGLSAIEPPRRRLEVVRRADPVIIDDTVGHPDSINAVFEMIPQIPHERLSIVFCVRGMRGLEINARDAEVLAIWARRVPVHALHVTSAEDTADERNRVTAEERAAFLAVLERAALPHRHHDLLKDAVAAALTGARPQGLVLLLGAQGMDAGAGIALELLDPAEQRAVDQSAARIRRE